MTEPAIVLQRYLQLSHIIKNKSFFLLGPRKTGKSFLLKQTLPHVPSWNLLDAGIYRDLTANPTHLRKELLALPEKPQYAIIDEVQRIPELLNEVHLMIEEHGIHFALTGSSARALKRKGVNLLGGRARNVPFHPLTFLELGGHFDLNRALNYGLLPSVYLSQDPKSELKDYAGVYLKEEVAAEGLSRNIPSFSRFLEIAAMTNGQLVNFTNMASDAQVKRTTVVDWYTVLLDTLQIFEVPMWQKTVKRKPFKTSKFYFFDAGVAHYLAGKSSVPQKGAEFGEAFENYMAHELKTACDYGLYEYLHTWRSNSHYEVDFILNHEMAIEVKGKSTLRPEDLKGLRALKEEKTSLKRFIVVYTGDTRRLEDFGIEVIPYKEFLKEIWGV